MRGEIILTQPMELMTTEQQEKIWLLSRTNNIYVRDINGVLWQVLDLTSESTDSVLLAVRESLAIGRVAISRDTAGSSDSSETNTNADERR